jgi:hypothetical protein
MPLLIRFIAQRVFLVGLSLLTVVGVNPQIDVLSEDDAQIATEERKDTIQETLSDLDDSSADFTPALNPKDISTYIPLPQINIFKLPTRVAETPNITLPTDTSSHPVVPQKVPTQTAIPTPTPTAPKPTTEPTPTPTTSTPPKTQAPTTPVAPKPTTPTPTPQITPDTSSASTLSNIVVSILCVRYNGNRIHVTNGSGVLVSSKGVVLTNSHVAQMFLLKDRGYDCSIRRENIPTYGWKAVPLYISEQWVEDNYMSIGSPSPVGTGENDYALLLITENTNPSLTLPQSFPSASINTRSEAAEIGDAITVAGYPGIQTSDFNLATQASLKTEKTTIKNVFTLARISVDVFATKDTVVAKRGSSGGGVFEDGELIGTIVTTSQGSTPATLVINALTLDYINRDIKDATGLSLTEYLSGDVEKRAQTFQSSVAPHLTELLLRNL